ncbi:hypothetical protein LEM8419_01846 [Neolewinella maritima]|uniref:HTH luxR-type domain-containing protein n=1 Tax=Neolewinella maritima TaxID=1383882 RepID=A0ABM9B1K0_9BACT|nr:two-component regulator propeller domain-containing protein [Neolewinella maritima]CAH1000712.1 hypothetical protein LEM8419_01846 [Neolewinella maritima]
MLSITCYPIAAQDTGAAAAYSALTPRVRGFSEVDYGGENQNWDLTQSPDGVMYVANSGGVLRFDGLNWSIHQLPARPTVRTVAWADGRLYVGGYGEFGYFPQRAGRLGAYVSLSARLPIRDRGEEIWNIVPLADSTVAFQSFSHLYWLEGDSLRTELPGSIMFAHGVNDRLLLPITGKGIVERSAKGPGTLLPGSDPSGQPIVGLAGPADHLLVATEDRIYRYRDGGLHPWSSAADSLLTGQQINRLISLRDGRVAVGTIVNGVYVFTAAGVLSYQLRFGNGLSNNTVLSLFEDRSGNLWAGLDRGLDLIARSEPLRFYQSGTHPIGAVYAAAHYGPYIYLGTNQGLYRYDSKAARYSLVAGTAGQVWELRPTPYGLLCGHNDGTFMVEGDRARKISDRSGGWQTLFLPGDSSRVLQATYTGLSLLDLDGRDAGAEVRLEGLLGPIRYIALTGTRELLALHGARGAFRIALSDDWRRISHIDTLSTPDLVRPQLARFGDTLLVQTDEGVFHYLDGRLNRLVTFRGVPLPPTTYVLPGEVEWFVLRPDRITVYRGRQQLAAYALRLRRSYPYLTVVDDSTYLLGLEDGFATYRPEAVADPSLPMYLSVETGDGRDSEGGRLVLPYRENDVRFAYALPALDREVHYRSRLLGFSNEWSEWSVLGVREFTNIPEGNYRYEVEADWYAAVAALDLRVLPPWYRTSIAYLIYTVLLLGLIYFLYRAHHERLARQGRHLEVVRQRQLQRQRIETQNEQLEADNRRKSRELANTTLTLAKKNEMLLNLKEELTGSGGAHAAGGNPQKLLRLINRNLNNEDDWAIFESHFNEVHAEFLQQLRELHPNLPSGDLQLAAYLRMDLSSKDIAPLLHISVRSVENKRYRLRKRMGLAGNVNLNQYLQTLC